MSVIGFANEIEKFSAISINIANIKIICDFGFRLIEELNNSFGITDARYMKIIIRPPIMIRKYKKLIHIVLKYMYIAIKMTNV